jgi:hypothetical protein
MKARHITRQRVYDNHAGIRAKVRQAGRRLVGRAQVDPRAGGASAD